MEPRRQIYRPLADRVSLIEAVVHHHWAIDEQIGAIIGTGVERVGAIRRNHEVALHFGREILQQANGVQLELGRPKLTVEVVIPPTSVAPGTTSGGATGLWTGNGS